MNNFRLLGQVGNGKGLGVHLITKKVVEVVPPTVTLLVSETFKFRQINDEFLK